MIHCVLFSPEPSASDSNTFAFDAKSCTVDELLKAFENTYPNLIHTLDRKTGVIWLHPKAIQYNDILARRVKVSAGAVALPMQKGILNNIFHFPSLELSQGWNRMTMSDENQFNYAVDLPEGTFSIKDILNSCLLANPAYSFFFTVQQPGKYFIRLANLGYRGLNAMPYRNSGIDLAN